MSLHSVYNAYDQIPTNLICGNILDVGCGDLSAQLNSKHGVKFKQAIDENRYIGIDLPTDIRTWTPETKFDTILCIQMIAYLPIEDWFSLFYNLKSWLKPSGHIILIEAYKKNKEDTLNIHHKTFNIDHKIISRYLPNPTLEIFYSSPPFYKRFSIAKYLRNLFFGNRNLLRGYIQGYRGFITTWSKE